MIRNILIGLGFWLLVFLPSSIIGGFLSRTKLGKSVIIVSTTTQILFIVLSILVILFFFKADFKSFGFSINIPYTIDSLIISFPIAILLAFLSSFLTRSESYKPQFLPQNPLHMILLALILAPLGEEMVFRGILESYLLQNTNTWIAVVFPAILFALTHTVPFSSAPKKVLMLILINASILGILAGYYRAIGRSLTPAIAIHATFNLAGIIVRKILMS
ncbi:MAG: CPBP family intramembrane metalloprotease [Thermofilum sp. ex4484_79]|nr:MAG: CPBP family intramembrane metalloprotease [Thermofilum sp. ex4484_79]